MIVFSGQLGGRNKIDDDTIAEICRLATDQHLTVEEIHEETGIGVSSIDKFLRMQGIKPERKSKKGIVKKPVTTPLTEAEYSRVHAIKRVNPGILSSEIAESTGYAAAEVNAAYATASYTRYLRDR